MLVRTPAPVPTESLFGYILRVTESNGYDTPRHILDYAGYNQGSMRSAIFHIDKLAEILGRNSNELKAIAYSIEEDGKRAFKILNHHLGKILPDNFLRLTKPKICIKCVQEYKIIDAFWDLNFAVACPQHHCQLLDSCPKCKKKLRWFRPGLLTCSCGANLAEVGVFKPVDAGMAELMAIINAKLHGASILSLPNTMGFPIQELESQSLSSFIWIATRLGKYGLFSPECQEIKEPYAIMEAVSEILRDWPDGYQQFLHELGMKLTASESLSSVGLRKQFIRF